jgi:hypothetical protein
VKILRVRINGFRSLRAPQTIELRDGRSLSLLADNGRGKSSVVDALEFWSTGDVEWVHRENVGLGALVHLRADEATVEVKTATQVASRTLKGTKAGDLVPGQGPMTVGFDPGPIPILRHRTMASFVDKSAGDKRADLLAMLGMDGLVPFRAGLRSAARRAAREADVARRAVDGANAAWSQALGGSDITTKLADLSSRAQLATPLVHEDDLLHFAVPATGTAGPAVSRLAQADELAEANAALAATSVDRWNRALSDQAVAAERALSTLLDAGKHVLSGWPHDSCPLCLVEQPRDELSSRVQSRAAELAAADARFAAAATEAAGREQATIRFGRALRAVVDDARNTDWGHLEEARDGLAALRVEARLTVEARRERKPLNATPRTLPAAAVDALRDAAVRAPGETAPALLELTQLRAHLKARIDAEDAAARRTSSTAAIEAAARIGDAAVRKAIDDAIAEVNDTLAEFYGKLVGPSPYSDVRLEYRDSRAGGVDFAFVWDGDEEVCPPQRVMSESQLGALGLSLFLARLKVKPPQWRTLVLDDVVTSFDAVHRTRLVRLLENDFGDWQIILCTHDAQLGRAIEDETSGWARMKVTSWTPADGPVFGESDPRRRLRQRLQQGHAPDELGGLARQAVEQALERPLRRMGLRIRHDPGNQYSADEYRRALIKGLVDGGYAHAEHAVLRRLATDGTVTNRACHFKDHEPGITEADLDLLLEDLDELDSIFVCDTCERPTWEVQDRRTRRCQCSCGALTCASA